MRKLQLILGLGMIIVMLLTACVTNVQANREVEIFAGEQANGQMYFQPRQITVKAGERLTFVVKNEGKIDHEFESDEAGIEEVVVPPGRTRRVAWQAPSKLTTLPVYCDLPGHREVGMELFLVVE